MRAPHLGHSKGKPRKGKGRIGPAAVRGRALAALASERPDVPLFHAVGLKGANVAPPEHRIKYVAPKTAEYSDGSLGAPCTLHLFSKSMRGGPFAVVTHEGPVITKPYRVIVNKRGGQ